MGRVLVIDDEVGVRESLRLLLKGIADVVLADSAAAGLRELAASEPDLILLDLVMPGGDGLSFLEAWRERGAAPPVVIVSATRTVETAVEAMRLGAIDYVTKPFEAEPLRRKVRELLELAEQRPAREPAPPEAPAPPGLIGRSPAMRALYATVERVAHSSANVLIAGESGVGKELVARAIHELGPRRDHPFVAVNCAAIPDTLLESELFGHERGAFTDADRRRTGRFEAADSGTLFLDEIGDLGHPVQAKLLRALQERVVERLGANEPVPVDVRVIAATHRDLEAEVEGGRFRADLYFRIHVLPVDVPPLRAREGDVALLARAFLERSRRREGRGPSSITPEALAILEQYPWPGNVRELQNVIERAVALGSGEALGPDDLPAALTDAARARRLEGDVARGHLALDEATGRFERALLEEALVREGWNQTRAAQRLGITRRALKLKMDRHGLSRPTSQPGAE